ncbi:MAG: hypothetical protein IJ325_06160, partial [Clostridia bacterium]|nr:hypothetical protein [Clostridia bacterium]
CMCIKFETAGEIHGEKSTPFDYTVIESVSLLEDGLFSVVHRAFVNRTQSVTPLLIPSCLTN